MALEAVADRSSTAASLLQICAALGDARSRWRRSRLRLSSRSSSVRTSTTRSSWHGQSLRRRFSVVDRVGDDLVMHKVVRELVSSLTDSGGGATLWSRSQVCYER